MKILFVPKTHTSKRITSSSSVAYWLDYAKISEGVTLDIIVPIDTDTSDVDLPNVNFLKIATPHRDPWVNHLDDITFQFLKSKHSQYSLVLTNLPYWVQIIETAMFERIWGGMMPRYNTPVVLVSDEYADKELQWTYTPWAEWATVTAAAHVPTMMLTQPDIDKLIKDAVSRLSPSVTRDMYLKNVKPIVYCPNELISPRVLEHGVDTDLVIMHGGTVPKRKRVDKLLESVEKARVLYPNIRVLLTSPKELPDDYKKYDFVDWHENVSRDQFKAFASGADLFYCGPEYIGTGLGYVQSVYEGLPGLFLYGEWLSDRLPDGYSLVAHDKRSLDALILDLAKRANDTHLRQELATAHSVLLGHWLHLFSGEYALMKINSVFRYAMARAGADARKTKHFVYDIIEQTQPKTYEQFLELSKPHLKSDKIDLRKIVTEGMFYGLVA